VFNNYVILSMMVEVEVYAHLTNIWYIQI